MARNRGRDVSITSGTLPLNTTRLVGVNPLGFTVQTPAQTPIADTIISRSAQNLTHHPSIYATPPNRVAKNAPGNDNLYRPPPIPQKLKICQDRTIRREVIFASGKGGRNGQKTARFTPNSKVKCK